MTRKHALGLLAAVLLLEVVARFFVADWDVQQALAFDPSATSPCFRLKRGAKVHYDGWLRPIPRTTIRVNSDAMRGPSVALQRAASTPRVALIGDSHIFGLGVEHEATLGERLRPRLAQALGVADVQVLNFGVPGYDFTAMVSRISEDVGRWQPDVVAIFVCADDLDRPVCGRFAHNASWLRHLALGRLWLASRRPPRRAGKTPMSVAEVRGLLQRARAAIGPRSALRLVKLCDLGGPRFEEEVSLAVQSVDGQVLDAAKRFAQLSAGLDHTAIRYDGHLNDKGNRLFAAHLAAPLANAVSRSGDRGAAR